MWQSLSKAFGKKVTKNNFHKVLKHQCVAIRTAERSCKKWQQAQASFANLVNFQDNIDNQKRDWKDAVDVSVFYGRDCELTTLQQWLQDRCRLVLLSGMGGIGKTSLAVKIAEQVQDEFKFVIWRSLRNAPPIKELLVELILFFL